MLDREKIVEALAWVERETHLKTRQARMLSCGDQGELLQMLSLMIKPKNILELGAFTGYSTICLSRGLQDDGMIDTIEVNDELQDIIETGFQMAGLLEKDSEKVRLHIGDAKSIVSSIDKEFDMVYIDANKREYCEYYNLVFDKVKIGGIILADNVLWSGKVLLENPPTDAQTQSIIRFNNMVKNDKRVEVVTLPLRDGLSLIYKISKS